MWTRRAASSDLRRDGAGDSGKMAQRGNRVGVRQRHCRKPPPKSLFAPARPIDAGPLLRIFVCLPITNETKRARSTPSIYFVVACFCYCFTPILVLHDIHVTPFIGLVLKIIRIFKKSTSTVTKNMFKTCYFRFDECLCFNNN